MRWKQKINCIIKAIRGIKSYKAIITAKRVYKIYGFSGFKRAVANKAMRRPLLEGVVSLNQRKLDNDLGNSILIEQQKEFKEEEIKQNIVVFNNKPLISVIMPMYSPPLKWLEVAIKSLQGQYYTNWELCIVDDCSTDDNNGIRLVETYMKIDKRIRLVKAEINGGISKASNISLGIASGQYVALLDQDDVLPPDAFFWFIKEINQKPEADFLYSDECKISDDEKTGGFDFLFKPDWAPCLMINNMFVGHLVMYKTSLLREHGGFNAAFDFGQDYELAVRMGDLANCIVHIPRILYFWRALPTSTAAGGKTFSNKINMAVPYQWLRKKHINSVIKKNGHYNYPLVLGMISKISLIVAPRNFSSFKDVLTKVIDDTNYKNYEIVVVADKYLLEKINKEYPYIGNLKTVSINENVSLTSKFNFGAKSSLGEIFVFINDTAVPLNRDWLDRLTDAVFLPKVGAASPAVLNETHLIKYAGSSLYFSNTMSFVGTPYANQPFYGNCERYLTSPLVSKECVTLSRDCIAVKKEIFDAVNGFDEKNTAVLQFNEDFSFKLRETGLTCFYTANSQISCLSDFPIDSTKNELLYCLLHWGKYYTYDPYFSELMKFQLQQKKGGSEVQFFAKNIRDINENQKKILVFSHELSRTGAPVVILDAVKEMISDGYYVVVVSPFDGDLRTEYEDIGVPVIIDYRVAWGRCEFESRACFEIDWYLDVFIKSFDLLFIGTLMGHNLIARYQNYNIPTMWWIHEGSYTLDIVSKFLPKKLNEKVKVFCGGKYVQDMLAKYKIEYKNQELLYGVKDCDKELYCREKTHEKIRFLIAGTIDERKGQDIVFGALGKLDKNILEKTEFIFVGGKSFGKVYDKIIKIKDKYLNVKIMDSISRDELFKLYNEIDCLLCASRDDPMPVVATEAMMFSKICLCSTGTGTSRYITDGENGFVFENENEAHLAKKITYIVEHKNAIQVVGESGRFVYEQNFSTNKFRARLKDILKKSMD